MSEVNQQGVEQGASTPKPAATSVEPVDIPDTVFQDIYNGHRGLPQTAPTEEPKPVQAEPVVPAEPPEPMSNPQIEALTSQVQFLQNQIANQRVAQSPAQQAVSLKDQLAQQNPGVTRASLDWLVDSVKTIQSEQNSHLESTVNQLANVIQGQLNQKTVDDFNGFIDSMCEAADISEGLDRRMMRHTIVAEGLEKYGQQFGKDQARTMFHTLNNARVEKRQASQEALVNDKEGEARNTPPQQTSQSPSTAMKSVRQAIRDPNNKSMDFQGQDMESMVGRFFAATDAATGNALGE